VGAEEARAFLGSVADDRLVAAWTLLGTRGLRRGELASLRQDGVDPFGGSIRITRTRVLVDGKPIGSEPKTDAGRRTIPLDSVLIWRWDSRSGPSRFKMGRAPSTISREVNANGGRGSHRAFIADEASYRRARRPKVAKLAQNRRLRAKVEAKLKADCPQRDGRLLCRLSPDVKYLSSAVNTSGHLLPHTGPEQQRSCQIKENVPMKNLSKARVAALAGVGLAGVIAPLALAGPVYASNPGNGSVTIANQDQANQWMSQGGVIKSNVDVPQGADVQLRWVDIKGNLNVEGKLSLASSQIEGNATVTGPGAGLSLFNDPGNHFYKNLTVNAAGGYYDGSWINTSLGVYSNGQQVDGSLAFTNNTGSATNFSGSMTVNGSLTYSGNALPYAGGLTVGH
jgi:hypothetical protein